MGAGFLGENIMKSTIKLGYGFTFDTRNGCLQHPGGHLTSWFRKEGEGFSVLEWATYLSPEMSSRICNLLANPVCLAGKFHLPLRGAN